MRTPRATSALAAFVALAVGALPASCGHPPPRCPYVPASVAARACPVCVPRAEIEQGGEVMPVPSFTVDAPRSPSDDWDGSTLPEAMPPASAYVHCRPCQCNARGFLQPYDEWRALNQRAYARLRTARAPYPVAIVPGFHLPGVITNFRVRRALELLEHGWVAALIFSGGHRRSGRHEGAMMVEVAYQIAARMGLDVADKIFVEPCACHTSTNVRNSLRMMAALRLPRGVIVTETRMTGQGNVFGLDFDGLVQRDLGCYVGRLSHLRGPIVPNAPGENNGCRPALSLANNWVTVPIPRREPVLYWASPFGRLPDGRMHSTLDCGVGSARVAECESDAEDERGACMPVLGRTDLSCDAPTSEPVTDPDAAPEGATDREEGTTD